MKSKARSTALPLAVEIDELPGIRRCVLLWLSDRTAQLIDDAISIKITCAG